MDVFFLLCIEFFKTGLFAVGGGLATLPFLYEMAEKYTWFDKNILSDMIALSESSPGPIGVNMATYAGYHAGYTALGFAGGILGAAIATLSIITPSIIVILIVARFLKKFQENKLVKDAFYTLRPAVTALIGTSGFTIIQSALFNNSVFSIGGLMNFLNIPAVLLFAVLMFATNFWKKLHPVFFILIAAAVGIILKM